MSCYFFIADAVSMFIAEKSSGNLSKKLIESKRSTATSGKLSARKLAKENVGFIEEATVESPRAKNNLQEQSDKMELRKKFFKKNYGSIQQTDYHKSGDRRHSKPIAVLSDLSLLSAESSKNQIYHLSISSTVRTDCQGVSYAL